MFYQYRLETLWLSSTPFEKELGFVEDTKWNMSQQCVLLMHMADWSTSVASRSMEDFPPLLSTGVATSAILCPALGPPSSTAMFRNWRGCREEVTSFSLEGSNWTLCFTRKVVQHWNGEVVGCPSFDVFKVP